MGYLNTTIPTQGQDAIGTEQYCHSCGCQLDSFSLGSDVRTPCPDCGGLSRMLEAMEGGELPFLHQAAAVPELKASHKSDAIREIVENLATQDLIRGSDIAQVVDTLMKREELGSTGIGNGMALPHAKHPCIDHIVGTVAWSPRGIQFDSIDDRPVHLIVLILSPIDQNSEHIRALAKVAQLLRSRG